MAGSRARLARKKRLFAPLAPLIWAALSAGPQDFAAAASTPANCAPLAPARGAIIKVAGVGQLRQAVQNCPPGGTILLADGSYDLEGGLILGVTGMTLRSASGDREAVVLDGHYRCRELVQVVASDVTLADLSLKRAYDHAIHVMSGSAADTLRTRIYNVHINDAGEQAVKINPTVAGHYPDDGVIACSAIELTDVGRLQVRNNCYTGGVDGHDARGWVVRDNVIQGFWCPEGLSEHAIHFWRNSRDTTVERNDLRNNARGIGFGMMKSDGHRRYPDLAAQEPADHVGGVIRNNFVSASNQALFRSRSGFDCGISLWRARGARVLHNSVFSSNLARSFSSIEWRFPVTRVEVVNNLSNIEMRQRDGAFATRSGNVSGAQATWFFDALKGDLHLVRPLKDQTVPPFDVIDDFNGAKRTAGWRSDAGADQFRARPGSVFK